MQKRYKLSKSNYQIMQIKHISYYMLYITKII